MADRDRYIPGVPCWTDTSQPDPAAAAEFYGGLFGWDLEENLPADVPGRYLVARLDGQDVAAVSSIPEGAPQVATWNTYVWVESADDAAARAREAGGNVLVEPFDVMDSGRMATFTDPEGAAISAWQPKEHRGAGLVNAPGAVNFNDLNTRDSGAVKDFYEAVFGWRVLSLGGGAEMWALPGYGEFLDEINPGTLENMAEMGAPEGFVDVVASIAPIPGEQRDVPAHWGVTFAVEDADRTAERAAELGGTVVVPPFDAPWVRMTVITDPQGATFTASKFVPENKDLAGAG